MANIIHNSTFSYVAYGFQLKHCFGHFYTLSFAKKIVSKIILKIKLLYTII